MWNEPNRPDYQAGIRLLRQEYKAAIVDIEGRQDLTEVEQLRHRFKLAEDYRRRRAQELNAISAQMRTDLEIGKP